MDDAIDGVVSDLATVRPDLDSSGVAVTGRLLRLARHVAQRREAALRACDLTAADYDVLATLRRREGETGVNPRALHRALMVTSGGMTKRLDRLERAGWTERLPDPADRRGLLVRLTDAGRTTVDRALDAVLTSERALVEDAIARPDDRDRLVRLLRELLATLESAAAQDQGRT